MKKLLLLLALTVPMYANPALFKKYEAVRQALLKNSLKDVQKTAAALASDAQKAKLRTVTEFAQSVALAKNLDDARRSFAALSDEMIKLPGRPAVYYCDMARRSWLQPKGKVGNPYEPAMQSCGTLNAE
jgi:Zn-dependent oligopeptidases